MSGLHVNEDLCIGCGLCVRACGSAGIELAWEGPRKLARVTGGCILCGSCVDACPKDALSVERDVARAGEDLSAWRGIWVVAQADAGGAVLPVTFELVGRACELAAERGCEVTAVYLHGRSTDGQVRADADRLVASGVDRVLSMVDERLAGEDAQAHALALAELARAERPEAVLFGATAFGRALAPEVAQRLGTGLTADCTVLGIDAETGLLQQTRPAFGGNLMATIECPVARPQMATVRPGIFKAPELDEAALLNAAAGRVEEVAAPAFPEPRVRVLEIEPAAADTITDAEVLVVVGRGIGSKKNLALMERLAELLGGKLGCTRPIVEAGWLPSWRQVGQTGVSVAPRLLISVGASGAIQHLAGIGGAQTVVAINEDADAPIFGAATHKVVGDAVEVVGELVAALEARAAR